MKKIALFIIVVSSVLNATAQLPDFGFETWANVPFSTTVQDPQGWASFNVVIPLGMGQTVFKETTAPFAGTASAKIVTDVLPSSIMAPNPFTPGQNFDTVGILGLGTTQFSSPYIRFGKPYASRPTTLSFNCKYTPMNGDSAFVVAFLTKWNTNHRDTIAAGLFATGVATTSYSLNTLTMNYNSSFASVIPDTQHVFISSSIYKHDGAQKGSTLYVDDVAWTGYNSVNDINGALSTVSVFPNPATNIVNLQSSVNATMIEVLDITGRSMGVFQMMNNKATVSTQPFATGIYVFNVYNEKKEIVHRGKFEVTK